MRFALTNSGAVRAEDLKYSDATVREVLKTVIIPLWNAYSFFVTYANIDEIQVADAPENPGNPLDRWILSEAENLVASVAEELDRYELQRACAPIVRFIDLLNNWYIRRSRRRFWRSENDTDKAEAYRTLYAVLMKFALTAAPLIPFTTEAIYTNLRTERMPESVHLSLYPVANQSRRDLGLEQKMATTQQAVSMGRAIRSMHNLKNRQPLKAIHLVTREASERRILVEMEEIIRDELNVKSVIFRENEEELVEYAAKANFRKLGSQLGSRMRDAAARIEKLTGREIQGLLEGSTLNLERIEKENLKVLNEGSLTVALDPEITEELRHEGIVRDLVRQVQNHRKESGLEVADRITLLLDGGPELRAAVEEFQEYLMSETLAVEVRWGQPTNPIEVSAGDVQCTIAVEKA